MQIVLLCNSRNVVFHSVAFTRDDNGLKAKQWRLDIARESMALLRLLVTGEFIVSLHLCTKKEFFF